MGDRRINAMLRTLNASGGVTDASDYPDDLLRPWYDDRGRRSDTFNLAIELGLITVSHDSDSGVSIARITAAGLATLQDEEAQP